MRLNTLKNVAELSQNNKHETVSFLASYVWSSHFKFSQSQTTLFDEALREVGCFTNKKVGAEIPAAQHGDGFFFF